MTDWMEPDGCSFGDAVDDPVQEPTDDETDDHQQEDRERFGDYPVRGLGEPFVACHPFDVQTQVVARVRAGFRRHRCLTRSGLGRAPMTVHKDTAQ